MVFAPHEDGLLSGNRQQSSRRLGDLMRAEARAEARAAAEPALLTEEALISEFGASRNTIRAALGLLQEQGVVSRQRGVGTRVSRHWDWSDLAELRGLSGSFHG